MGKSASQLLVECLCNEPYIWLLLPFRSCHGYEQVKLLRVRKSSSSEKKSAAPWKYALVKTILAVYQYENI
jgi:hypothetical protein